MSEQENETSQPRASVRERQKPKKLKIDESEPNDSTKRKSRKAKKKTTKRKVQHGEKKPSLKEQRKRRKREAEKERKRREKEAKQTGPRFVAADDQGEAFYEVERYLGQRTVNGRKEVLVHWKGCPDSENTWEPLLNLCDTAYADALKYMRQEKEREESRKRDDERLFNDIHDDSIPQEAMAAEKEDCSQDIADSTQMDLEQYDDHWEWSEREQVVFQDVERINVHDENARKRVTEARVNGTPVVLVGHIGWANFAKRWLTFKIQKGEAVPEPGTKCIVNENGKLQSEAGNETENGEAAPEAGTSGIENENGKVLAETSVENEKGEAVTAAGTNVIENESCEAVTAAGTNGVGNENGKVQLEAGTEIGNGEVIVANTSNIENESSKTALEAREHGKENGNKEVPPEAGTNGLDELLDLSKPYDLNISKMVEDIGMEDVPVVRRNYNETDPIHGVVHAAKFLKTCWPSSSTEGTTASAASARLYLHQWQFPLSDTAGRKLCHQSNPLPNDILGEDLLKYWLDLPQCKSDSPLQYLFMGREETMSKLHKDAGGLAISIAPIVGEKECVLVHRNDGVSCLYHLDANLDKIDLHSYPLMAQARIWKTTVRPGEILLMPQGTYHQCRNVTPCLSYSRFHLDTVNLLPFLQSMIDGDALEIDHDWVLWNCTSELMKKVDEVADEAKARIKAKQQPLPLTEETVKLVDTLRALRNIVREVARRIALRKAVKGKANGAKSAAKGARQEKQSNGSGGPQWCASDDKPEHDWDVLVYDVDYTLHEFRYRHVEKMPPFRQKKPKSKNALLEADSAGSRGLRTDSASMSDTTSNDDLSPVVAYDSILEKAFLNLPKVTTGDSPSPNVSNITPGDDVLVQLHGKKVKGKVLQVEPDMQSAYLSFEDYPALYNEYAPYDRLRKPMSGGPAAEVRDEEVKPGLVVIHLEQRGDQYRGKVQFTTCELMFRVRLKLGQCQIDRWMTKGAILQVGASKKEARLPVSSSENLDSARPLRELESEDTTAARSNSAKSSSGSKYEGSDRPLSGIGSRVMSVESPVGKGVTVALQSPVRKGATVAHMSVLSK